MLEIDGAYLEGGGQILRTAGAMSAVTGVPCRIVRIRRGRPNPGLRPQHLKAIEALCKICQGRAVGAEPASECIEFYPGPLSVPDRLSIEVGTAGSVALVLQALLIPLAHCGKKVELSIAGGTHVEWAPVMEYFDRVSAYFLAKAGISVALTHLDYGFYPKGGGKVTVIIEGGRAESISLTERGRFLGNAAWSIATEDLKRARVAERQLEAASKLVELHNQHAAYVRSRSTGTCIFLLSSFENCRLGASALGRKGKPAEAVGRECADSLKKQTDSGACLDEHMADQILPYMALAQADSRATVAAVTNHCRTNAWVLEKFLPVRFSMDPGTGTISCGRP